jgi:hypothetical protein
LIGHIGYGAERQGERYTAERCNEEKCKLYGFKLPVIPAKGGIQGIYPKGGQKEQRCRNNRGSITITGKEGPEIDSKRKSTVA